MQVVNLVSPMDIFMNIQRSASPLQGFSKASDPFPGLAPWALLRRRFAAYRRAFSAQYNALMCVLLRTAKPRNKADTSLQEMGR